MKKFTLVALAMMASASCFAQKTLWDGEKYNINDNHEHNGFWNRCDPLVAVNPDRGGYKYIGKVCQVYYHWQRSK